MLDEAFGSRPRGRAIPRTVFGEGPLTLDAKDGYRLGITLTRSRSNGPPVGVLVVAGAMAVPASRYQKLATFFAKAGYHVFTFDYRGIGRSLTGSIRGHRATLHEWGELDLASVLAHAEAEFPALPAFFLGHSVGGQLFGLVPPGRVRAAALFASQSGYFGHWSGAGGVVMQTLWQVVPALASACGYLPMKALGQGVDVPRDVAREWAKWGRDPRYILQWVESREQEKPEVAFASYDGSLRVYSFSDDIYAPKRAVAALASAYERAEKAHIHLEPPDVGKSKIGHFAILRDAYEATLWTSALGFFTDSVAR